LADRASAWWPSDPVDRANRVTSRQKKSGSSLSLHPLPLRPAPRAAPPCAPPQFPPPAHRRGSRPSCRRRRTALLPAAGVTPWHPPRDPKGPADHRDAPSPKSATTLPHCISCALPTWELRCRRPLSLIFLPGRLVAGIEIEAACLRSISMNTTISDYAPLTPYRAGSAPFLSNLRRPTSLQPPHQGCTALHLPYGPSRISRRRGIPRHRS
jgi:hypothetical protein